MDSEKKKYFQGEGIMAYNGNGIKRKVFISHYKGDNTEVEAFIDEFCDRKGVFIPKILGANENYDYIDSKDTDYVMNRIRKKYLEDSTVTIVLIGKCTHSRRYVDWEIKSSIRQGSYTPNGLIGIILPSACKPPYLPDRVADNWKKDNKDCYAKCWLYPNTAKQLHDYIEDAFEARKNRNHLIINSQDMMKYNKRCRACGVTH